MLPKRKHSRAFRGGTAVLAAAVLPLLLGNPLALAQNASFPPDQVKRGAALYRTNCESCHGVKMVGPEWAIDLQKFPKDQQARFIDSVTNGVRNMPPWGDVLKSDDIEALWAYVVTGDKRE